MYLVLDLLTGGDLRYQIGIHRRQYFSEHQTKFFISCIIESLSYIHSKNIIHRDIKPENLVFDDRGYLHITDFGIAKIKSKNNKNETSGTPGYMAPEVMKGMNHTGSVDYFAVGVITYELMMGQRPYIGKNRKEIKEQMMSRQIYIEEEMIPFGWSEESADFINRLIVRKETKRLGFYNDLEIKNHPWFFDINFDELVKKKLEAPFLPKINHDNYDKNYCEEIEKIGFETNYRYNEFKANEHYEDIFCGFTFYNVDETLLKIYKKPYVNHIQNIQNQNYKIFDNLKGKESKTINIDNYEKKNKSKKNIVMIRKKRNIDIERKIKNNENDTIDIEDNIQSNNINDNKSINIFFYSSQKKNDKKNAVINIHKRIKSNSIGYNFLYFLQKKKLSNLENKTYSLKIISNNDSTSINENKTKNKTNHSINYHKNNFDKTYKKIHKHANSFSNNLYVNLLNKIKEKNIKEDYYRNELIINSNKNIDDFHKKRTIELDKIPRLIKIYNDNYKSLKNIKKKIDIFSNIEHNESISNNLNDSNKKIDMMKASSNFYINQKIIKNKLNKITPINLRNKNVLLNTKYNFNKNYYSIIDDETITNSRRREAKIKTKSFSGRSIFDNLSKKKNIVSQEKNDYTKNDSSMKKNIKGKKIFLNTNYKSIINGEIRHNYSYSSFNNRNRIESLIKNLNEPEKHQKNTIPNNYKKSNNSSKISTLHKKIPIPSSFGQIIFHKRMNGYMSKKLRAISINSFNSSFNNNSINNSSSLSKNYIVNINTSANKSIGSEEYIKNNSNLNINNGNNSVNACKKKQFKSILNKNPNFTVILKKLNDFSKHKKNISFGNNPQIPKESNSRKIEVKNNLLKNKIKKIGQKKNHSQYNDTLKKARKKDKNEIKAFYGNILNNNIIKNKKCSNYNHKNKYNDSKIIKNSIGNFSYPSYNSTTSSGGKVNILANFINENCY